MKTYVLDASALFAFLQKRNDSGKVDDLLQAALHGRAEVLMSAVNCGEVYGVILRRFGSDQAARMISALSLLPVQLAEATVQRAIQAAEMKHKYKLYYADSFAAALAIEHKATLVTADSDFRRLGQGLPIIWLRS